MGRTTKLYRWVGQFYGLFFCLCLFACLSLPLLLFRVRAPPKSPFLPPTAYPPPPPPSPSLSVQVRTLHFRVSLLVVSRGVYRYGKSYRYAYLYRIVVPVFCTGIPCCCRSQPCRHLPFTSSPTSFSRPPFMLQSGLAWKKPDRPECRSKNRRSWVSWHTDYCFFLLIVLTSDTPKYCRRCTFFNLWRHSLPLPSVYFK